MATVRGAGSPGRQGRSSSASRSNFGRSRAWPNHSAPNHSATGHSAPNPSGRPLAPVPWDNLIQEQIIPRLLMAHSLAGPPHVADGAQAIDPEDASNFAPLPLLLEADELLTVVEAYLSRGVAVESIYVDLLAPSARKLGELWEGDSCDFLDVSMGLWRLQEVMREIAISHPSRSARKDPPRSALFLPMPGDDHSFGALMLEEVFARNGWQTDVLIEARRKELLQIVAEQHFDLVGLTLSNDCPTAVLKEIVSAIRCVSRSPKTQIFIGGRMVNDNPGIVAAVDADGTAPDALSFLELAELKISGSGRLDLSIA